MAWKRRHAWPGNFRTCGLILSMHNNENMPGRRSSGRGRLPAKKSGDGRTGNRLATGGSRDIYLSRESPRDSSRSFPCKESPTERPARRVTGRQREILQLIAEGQNTKQIAEILKVSPKTIEYHRMKLMGCLNIHDVPGLVRLPCGSDCFRRKSWLRARIPKKIHSQFGLDRLRPSGDGRCARRYPHTLAATAPGVLVLHRMDWPKRISQSNCTLSFIIFLSVFNRCRLAGFFIISRWPWPCGRGFVK